MGVSVNQRVEESFGFSSHEDVAKYLDWLNSTLSDITQTLRKTVALILSLMTAFILVNSSPTSEIDIGTIKVPNSSLVIVFLPSLISFLYFQIIRDTLQLLARSRAFTAAFSIWSVKAESNDLDSLISPSRAAYWDLGGTGRPMNTTNSEKIGKIGQAGAAPAIFVGVIAFEIYAYIHLRHHTNSPLILWAISLGVSCFFCGVAVVQICMKSWEDEILSRLFRKPRDKIKEIVTWVKGHCGKSARKA